MIEENILFKRMGEKRRAKVRKKILRLLLVLSLATGITTVALSQGQTGSIKGKITDEKGQPLPDAFIYVSSEAMLGMRTYLTSDTGAIRFPGLPPGIYKIIAEKPEYKTVYIDNIIVRVGKTVALNISLEMTAIEEETTINIPSPMLDEESIKNTVNIDKELLKNIPFAKSLHDIVNSAPGVIPESIPYQEKSIVHGSTVRGNIYAFDGMTMNDPAQMHLLTNINFDVIEEVELEIAAHPAEVGSTDGGYINVVAKSGGNRFSGGANLYCSGEGIASTLRSEEEINETGASPPVMDKYLWDMSLSLGGKVLEDMVWYFGNARLIFQSRTTPFIPWTDPQENSHEEFNWRGNEKMGFFKIGGQYASQFKLTGMFSYANRYRSAYEPALSWNLPEEATRILDHEKNYTVAGVLSYMIDQNTFVDIKAGYIHHRLPLRLNEQGIDNSQYFNEGTGYLWGSAGFNENQLRKRFQATAYLTRLQESFLGGDHEFKVGAEYEYTFEESAVWKADNLLTHFGDPRYQNFHDHPYYFGQDVSPVTGETVPKGKISFYIAGEEEEELNPKNELRRLSFFAQDSATFGDRLTLLIGLRFDRSTTRLHSHLKGESGNPVSISIGEELIEPLHGVNPYSGIDGPEWKDLMVWNALSPRFGLSFDISGNGKTVFKASFSRYTEYLMLQYFSALNPLYAYRSHQFYWFDEYVDGEANGEVDENDTFTPYLEDYLLYKEDYYKKRIAPDIKSPYTDEFTIGLHQEVFQGFSFRVNYIHKTKGNIIENVLYDPDLDKDWYTVDQDTENWWIPFNTTVPGVDDYDDTQVSPYYWSSSAPSIFYRVKNVPELKRKYQALEIALKKRMSNNWQLNGSVVFSKATGYIGLDYGASSGFPREENCPNYLVNLISLPEDSRLDFDRPLVIKLMGTYKFPYNFSLSFYYTHMSGTPWARSVIIIPPSSWIQENNASSAPAEIYLEKPGTRRRESYNNLDLRIEKEFRLGSSGRLFAFVDIVNVLGNKYDFTFQNDGGFWYPEDEDTNQGVRVLSSNYKKITSLYGARILRFSLSLNF